MPGPESHEKRAFYQNVFFAYALGNGPGVSGLGYLGKVKGSMNRFISILAAGAALISTATAQNSFSNDSQQSLVSNPSATIPNFDVSSMTPILTELGLTLQQGSDTNGVPFIRANIPGGLVFYVQPTACPGGGATNCVGLLTIAYFEGAANAQTVRAFNDRYHFSSTGLVQNAGAFISRYDIADYGVPRGNVASSIASFAVLANRFGQELASASQTISLEGYAEDLAAASLNGVALANLTGHIAHAQTPMERHQKSFDNAARDIVRMINDEALPRNKIGNLK